MQHDYNSVKKELIDIIKTQNWIEDYQLRFITDSHTVSYIISELEFDSLDIIDVVMDIESRFMIQIKDKDAEKFLDYTVTTLITFILGALYPSEPEEDDEKQDNGEVMEYTAPDQVFAQDYEDESGDYCIKDLDGSPFVFTVPEGGKILDQLLIKNLPLRGLKIYKLTDPLVPEIRFVHKNIKE